ncbi:IS66 family insertion sequence element accessory protein TnpA [Neorhodopirellula pilleata]|uniref:Transposase n=2 Tax=Neorhodopirellula pilleata TaxID=2714738 RepID=A0A5C6A137_9BACT|nr:hypothetical protein [Neorhodopirellula pilleata]TWT92263.1 hypothetical protein Pla100_48010 [Neorhodopirellula pilleata]
MNAFPNPELARQWRERIERFDDAGTTIAEFCHAEGYSVASFYQWRRRLRQAACEPAGFIAVEVPDNQELSVVPANIEIELPGGAIVRLNAHGGVSVFEPLLAAVVAATDAAAKEAP